MKHYGEFLPFAGKGVKYKAEHISYLLSQKERLQQKISKLNFQIRDEEKEFDSYIEDEWNTAEILDAKHKAVLYNTEKRIKL